VREVRTPALRFQRDLTRKVASYADAVALRDAQATPIMQSVRSDVTRFRYGDEQHLDDALERIFRINKAREEYCGARRCWPYELTGVGRRAAFGATRRRSCRAYGRRWWTANTRWCSVSTPHCPSPSGRCVSPFVQVRVSPGLTPQPQSRTGKFASFFGPGARAMLTQTESGVDVSLVADGTVAGGQMMAESDVDILPPLMPGLVRLSASRVLQPADAFSPPAAPLCCEEEAGVSCGLRAQTCS